jgi:hypothetical protein
MNESEVVLNGQDRTPGRVTSKEQPHPARAQSGSSGRSLFAYLRSFASTS